jgi:ABC-type glycerol-3-phosphate transport system substrate-binding protein
LDWTLAHFLEIAEQLTTGEGDSKRYGYAATWPYLHFGSLQAFGVEIVDSRVNPPRLNFTAAADMITWHVNLVRLYEAQPLIHDDSGGNLRPVERQAFETLVREGRVAMWQGGGAGDITFGGRPPLNFDVGVLSLPLGPSGYRGGSFSPSAYHIMADTPHRQACWEWIRFLSTRPEAVQPVASASRMTTQRFLPAHIATAESEAYIIQVGEEMAAILQNFMRSAPPADQTVTPDYLSSWMSPGNFLLVEAYFEAVTGQASVTEALETADFKFDQYRQCLIDRDGFEEYSIQRACIFEVEPRYRWLFPERN